MAFWEPQLKPRKPVEAEKPPVEVTPPPKAAGPTPDDVQAQADARKRALRLGLVLGGAVLAVAGVAMVGVGGYEYGQASSFHDQFAASTDQATKAQAKSDGLGAGSLSTTMYAAGGAVLAVGAATVVVALVLPQLKPGATEKVAFAPWIAPGGAGAAVSCRF